MSLQQETKKRHLFTHTFWNWHCFILSLYWRWSQNLTYLNALSFHRITYRTLNTVLSKLIWCLLPNKLVILYKRPTCAAEMVLNTTGGLWWITDGTAVNISWT